MVSASSFVETLREHALNEATGAVVVVDATRTRSGRAFLDNGQVYAVHIDGFVPNVIRRFVSAGLLDTASRARVVAELDGDEVNPSAGPLCVQLGLVDKPALDAVHREVLLSSLGWMAEWGAPKARFRKDARTDVFTVPPVPVAAAVTAIGRRAERWRAVAASLAPSGTANEAVLSATGPLPDGSPPDLYALRAAANGARTLDEIAAVCGMSRFETGHLANILVGQGALEVTSRRPSQDVANSPLPHPGDPTPVSGTATAPGGPAHAAVAEGAASAPSPMTEAVPPASFQPVPAAIAPAAPPALPLTCQPEPPYDDGNFFAAPRDLRDPRAAAPAEDPSVSSSPANSLSAPRSLPIAPADGAVPPEQPALPSPAPVVTDPVVPGLVEQARARLGAAEQAATEAARAADAAQRAAVRAANDLDLAREDLRVALEQEGRPASVSASE